VRLTVYVEAVDQVSGQLVVGTQQTATERRNPAQPEATDVLVSKALAGACAQAARATATGPGVQGEVADPRDGKTIALKLPEQVALKPGQRLLLYRPTLEGDERGPGKLIAAVMVTKSEAAATEARVLARGGDIHTGDIAVTVGEAPQRETVPAGAKPR
jgi:hypothetical protein